MLALPDSRSSAGLGQSRLLLAESATKTGADCACRMRGSSLFYWKSGIEKNNVL
jgi:hypothetical protein